MSSPALCVLLPTFSAELRDGSGARREPDKIEGLYALAPMWRTALVVIHELPEVASTLWLRLLGRGEVQARAVRELLEMNDREPLRDATMQLLIAWQQSLPPPEEQDEAERELRMNWEQVYERWEKKVKAQGRREGKAEGLAEGKAEGRVEGKAEAVLAVFEGRGLVVSAAEREMVLGCTDAARLDAWLRAAATAPTVAALLSRKAAHPSRASSASRARASSTSRSRTATQVRPDRPRPGRR